MSLKKYDPVGRQQTVTMKQTMSLYEKQLDRCIRPPRGGGYSITELKNVAESMGIDTSVYTTRKEICKVIETMNPKKAVSLATKLIDMKGFVTLKDYVATEEARGPDAKRTQEYDYRSWYIQNFFMREIVKNNADNSICIPLFYDTKFGTVMAAVFIEQGTNKIYYDRKVVTDTLNICQTRSRFSMISVGLINPGRNHSTMAVIDFKDHTIEHFDSGDAMLKNPQFGSKIREFFDNVLPGYLYIKLWEICPYMLPQTLGIDAYKGMCVTYGVMYLMLRILNPTVSSSKILKHLTEGDKKDLRIRLLKFHRYMETTIKNAAKRI